MLGQKFIDLNSEAYFHQQTGRNTTTAVGETTIATTRKTGAGGFNAPIHVTAAAATTDATTASTSATTYATTTANVATAIRFATATVAVSQRADDATTDDATTGYSDAN